MSWGSRGNGFELVAEIVSTSYFGVHGGGYSHVMVVVGLQRLLNGTTFFQLASMLLTSAIILFLLGRLPVQRRHALDGGAHGAGTQCDMVSC